MNKMKLGNLVLWMLLISPLLGACQEPTFSAQLVAYNHSDTPIYFFTVNGTLGPNAMAQGGGGKFSCCVSLPEKWRPGMRAKITWEYDRMNETAPQLPPQSIEIEIPKYKKAGNFHVHFYENHNAKLLSRPAVQNIRSTQWIQSLYCRGRRIERNRTILNTRTEIVTKMPASIEFAKNPDLRNTISIVRALNNKELILRTKSICTQQGTPSSAS
jgi:hypothetical protein